MYIPIEPPYFPRFYSSFGNKLFGDFIEMNDSSFVLSDFAKQIRHVKLQGIKALVKAI